MKSSRSKFAADQRSSSTANTEAKIARNQQPSLFESNPAPVYGTYNDASVIRLALVEAIRKCGKTRDQIADEMSALTGTEVTVRRLNGFTADSREDYRFPAELARAFCVATNDFTLLRIQAELAGLHLITRTEYELLTLGREYLVHKRAEQSIAMLEKRLGGIEL